MGRKKKYTPKALREAVSRYFDSISREVTVMEKLPTGKKDGWGHEIYEEKPVTNKLGEEVKITEYVVPPMLEDLCLHLKIHSSTWSRWSDKRKYPELAEIIEDVRDRLLAWNKSQVVTRKNVRGVIWNLEVNLGCGKQEKPDDDRPGGVILMPQINELTPPAEEGAAPDG